MLYMMPKMFMQHCSSDFRRIKSTLETVDGWLSEGEARYLYALARQGPGKGAIVEIGSWKGKSTIFLAAGSMKASREKIHAIDHHKGGPDQEGLGYKDIDTQGEFRKNIRNAGVENHVVPVIMGSVEAIQNWNEPIRLLWIDGNHDYEAVKNDFLLWEPYVIDGGVIAFHDTYAWEGPRRVVAQYLLNSNRFTILGFIDTITAVKKQPPSQLGRVRMKLLLCIRQLYILGRQHVLPGEIRKWAKAVLRALASTR